MKFYRLALLCLFLGAGTTSSVDAEEKETPARGQGWDAIVGFGARTLPFGAGLSANAGYNLLWWGTPGPGKVFYGYMRPYSRLQVSGLVNRMEMGLEAFPLSFLGFTMGYAGTHRNTHRIATLDCTHLECKSWLGRNLFSTRLLLGYQDWILLPSVRLEGLQPRLTQRAFADENTNLVGRAGGDTLVGSSWTLAYRARPQLLTGFFLDTARMLHSGTNNLYGLGFGRWTRGHSIWTFSAGWFRSTFHKASPTISIVYERTFQDSLALH